MSAYTKPPFRPWENNEPRAFALMAEDPEFRLVDIAEKAGIGKWQAKKILRHWIDRGVVKQVRQHGHARMYVIVQKRSDVISQDAPEAPTASAEGNMWRSMRLLRNFSPLDVAAHASAGGIEVSEEAATRYCRALLRVGFLTVIQLADPSIRRPARYRLVQDTGPDAPTVRRVNIVYDPNGEQVHLLGGAPS